MALCLFVAFIVWFSIVFLHDKSYPQNYRVHDDLKKYQDLIHENEYFYENPDMYEDYLKLESVKKDWSIRNAQEYSNSLSTNTGTNGIDDKETDGNSYGNKEKVFLQPRIKIAPMTI